MTMSILQADGLPGPSGIPARFLKYDAAALGITPGVTTIGANAFLTLPDIKLVGVEALSCYVRVNTVAATSWALVWAFVDADGNVYKNPGAAGPWQADLTTFTSSTGDAVLYATLNKSARGSWFMGCNGTGYGGLLPVLQGGFDGHFALRLTIRNASATVITLSSASLLVR